MQNLCLEFADKILIFAVLRWRHLQWRETEASFVCFIIVAGLLGKIASSVGQCASPCQIAWQLVEPLHGSRYCNSTVLKMAAVRRLGFVVRVFGPLSKNIWWSLSLCKISLKSMMQYFRQHASFYRATLC